MSWYTPAYTGKVGGVNVKSFGVAVDPDKVLVAISVQGSSSAVDFVWGRCVSKDGKSLRISRGNSSYSALYPALRYPMYRAAYSVIPDTGEVSLQLLSKTMIGEETESPILHFPYEDDTWKDFFFDRLLLSTVYPIQRWWVEWLWNEGRLPHRKLCGIMMDSNVRDWNTRGYKIGYVRNTREGWHGLIEAGLRDGHLKIRKEDQSGKTTKHG